MPTTPDNTEEIKKRGLPFPLGWVALAIVTILAIVGATTAYVMSQEESAPVASSDDGEDTAFAAEEAKEAEEPEQLTTPFSDPGAFVDQDVNTSATITQVVDPNSFRIVSGTEDELLVIYNGIPVVEENMLIDVYGVMKTFTPTDVEEQLGAELPESTYEASSDEFAVVAHTVTIVKKKAGKGAIAGVEGGGTDAAGDNDNGTAVAATADVLTSNDGDSSAPSNNDSGDNDDAGGDGAADNDGPGGNGSRDGSDDDNGSRDRDQRDGSGDGSRDSDGRDRDGSGSGSSEGGGEVAYTGDSTSAQSTDQAEFEATLRGPKGQPIRDAKVTFTLKNPQSTSRFKGRTNRKGIARVTGEIDDPPGEYKLIVRHETSRRRDPLDKTTFVIEKDDSTLDLSAQDSGEGNGNSDKTTTLTAVLTETDEARGLAGRTVVFYADGGSIGSATTNEHGVATLEHRSQGNRQYAYEARFAGDDYFLGSGDSA